MPNNETAKTKSAPKRLRGWGLLAGVLLLVVAMVVWQTVSTERMTIRLGRQTYTLVRATTSEQKQKGLSGTASLGAGQGMFFDGDREAETCFWMKGMRYPLDIIWLGSDKKVAHIEHNVAPDTYPDTFCHGGQYVIEINAGQAARSGLQQGQSVAF